MPWDKLGVEKARAEGWELDGPEAKRYARGRPRALLELVDPGRVFNPQAPSFSYEEDRVVGDLWKQLAGKLPEDFRQVVTRRRVRLYAEKPHTKVVAWEQMLTDAGARFDCPKCGRKVGMLYLPVPLLTYPEYIGLVPRRERVGGYPEFACHHCHRVQFRRAGERSGTWNDVVAYYSGGLLYGREVRRPGWVEEGEKKYRAKVRRVQRCVKSTRWEEVVRRVMAGERYEEIGRAMGIGKESVRGMWNMYRPRGAVRPGRRKRGDELVRRVMAGETYAQVAAAMEIGVETVRNRWYLLRARGEGEGDIATPLIFSQH